MEVKSFEGSYLFSGIYGQLTARMYNGVVYVSAAKTSKLAGRSKQLSNWIGVGILPKTLPLAIKRRDRWQNVEVCMVTAGQARSFLTKHSIYKGEQLKQRIDFINEIENTVKSDCLTNVTTEKVTTHTKVEVIQATREVKVPIGVILGLLAGIVAYVVLNVLN